MQFTKYTRYTILFIVSYTLFRSIIAPFFGIGVDEAHYALYARYLDWSYFDHPGMIGWVTRIFTQAFGETEFAIRLPAILVGAWLSWLVFRFTCILSGNEKAAFYSVLALNGSFVLTGLAIMTLPDTLLNLFFLLLVLQTIKLDKNPSLVNYLLVGILFGICGVTKYTSILFVPPIVIFFLSQRKPQILFSYKILFTAIIALIIISPVFIWNIENEFVSFKYQGGHILGGSWKIMDFLRSLAIQFGAYSFFIFPFAVFGYYKSYKSSEPPVRLAFYFGTFILLFFGVSSFTNMILPHWTSQFYILFIPIGVHFTFELSLKRYFKLLRFGIVFSLILGLILQLELVFKMVPFPDYQSMHRDLFGWNEIMNKANEIVERYPSGQTAIAVSNWTLGSRAIFYSNSNVPVNVIDDRYTQFDLWQKEIIEGKDILILGTHDYAMDFRLIACENLELIDSLDLVLNNRKVNTVKYYWCRKYRSSSDLHP